MNVNFRRLECPLWVKSGHPPAPAVWQYSPLSAAPYFQVNITDRPARALAPCTRVKSAGSTRACNEVTSFFLSVAATSFLEPASSGVSPSLVLRSMSPMVCIASWLSYRGRNHRRASVLAHGVPLIGSAVLWEGYSWSTAVPLMSAPLWSRTTKQAACSSTVQGGGKRRAGINGSIKLIEIKLSGLPEQVA